MTLAGIDEDGTETFPQIRVYNPTGQLIKKSADASRSKDLLNDVPESYMSWKPLQGSENLSALIEAVPAFRVKTSGRLPSSGPTVLSLLLEKCKGCAVQEESLDEDQQLLMNTGVNVFVLHFAHP